MKTHHDLDVWKNSISLIKRIYILTESFPKHERFGLSSQMQRSAVSTASNIAEGAARNSDKDFLKFLHYSLGSLSELKTQVIIAGELNYTSSKDEIVGSISILRKQLSGLIRFIKKRISSN